MSLWDDTPYEDADRANAERVLVVIVPSLRDWEIVLNERWYRIPLQRAPRRIGASYLAFYHPGVFETLRWTISYYAPILAYRVVARRELFPQEANHPRADQFYYRISLGPIEPLPQPILSNRLRRVTFMFTSLEKLFLASEINDLWLDDNAQSRLRRARGIEEKPPDLAIDSKGADPVDDQTPWDDGLYSAWLD